MSATVTPRRNAATLMRPRSAGVTSIVSRAVKARLVARRRASGVLIQLSASPGRAAKPRFGRALAHGAILATSAASAAISRAAGAVLVELATRRPDCAASAKATRWPMRAGEHRRLVIGERFGGLAGDDRARGAAVQHEARDELRAEDARLVDQLQHLARRPAVERRWLGGDQHEVGGEQRRAHQPGDARRPVDDDVIGVAGDLRRLAMQRVARQADDAEQPRRPLPARAARDQSSAEPCGIGVDQGDARPSRPIRRRDAGRASSCRRRPSG
jgi:hypothetical protein